MTACAGGEVFLGQQGLWWHCRIGGKQLDEEGSVVGIDLVALHDSLLDNSTSPHEVENLLDRLSILAVAEGIKPAFMTYVDHYDQGSLNRAAKAAAQFGLTARRVRLNNDPWIAVPDIAPVALKAIQALWRTRLGREQLWIARGATQIPRRVRNRPDRTTGAHLGYPRCCDKSYREDYVRRAERLYEVIRSDAPGKADSELARIIRGDPKFTDEQAADLLDLKDGRMLETQRLFPYVQHVACTDCLRGESMLSRNQNSVLEQFADRVGMRDDILRATTRLLESGT